MEEMITGLGGVFIKSNDPEKTYNWYSENFGLKTNQYGKTFTWREYEKPDEMGSTQFSIFKNESGYFGNPEQKVMLNFRVKNLELLMQQLEQKGIKAVKPLEAHEYGKFCWVEDPEGNRIELWEPVDEALGL